MNRCPNCGSEYTDVDFFCSSCGFNVREKRATFTRPVARERVEFVAPNYANEQAVAQSVVSPVRRRERDNGGLIAGLVIIFLGLIMALVFLLPLAFSHIMADFGVSFGSLGAEFGRLGGEFGRLGGEFGRMGGELGGVFGELGGSLGSLFGGLGSTFGSFLGSLGYHLRWVIRILIPALFIIPGVIVVVRHRRNCAEVNQGS
jgi:hypothetical protein